MTKVQPGLEAETAVIGALLISPEIVKDVLFTVREQDFGIEINRKIFRAARDLYLRAESVTAYSIRDKVGKDSSDYIAQLVYITTTSADWRENAIRMADQACVRRMQALAMQLRWRRPVDKPRSDGVCTALPSPARTRHRRDLAIWHLEAGSNGR